MESRLLISLICYFCLAISQRRKFNINTMKAAVVRTKRLVGGGYANQGKSATLGKKLII
jgi:hypothetical protein